MFSPEADCDEPTGKACCSFRPSEYFLFLEMTTLIKKYRCISTATAAYRAATLLMQDFKSAHFSATAAFIVPEVTGVLRQSTAGLIRFRSMRSLYCADQAK
jgi:hypothetical protein